MNELDSAAHTGHRFAAELRDRQVLQQRRLRGRALRRKPGALRRSAEEPDHAVHAQHRPAADHRRGLVAMLWRATQGVVDGRMTLGDLVMVNAFMIQLYIPLNFLGVIYREIKQSLTDLDKMFTLMERSARWPMRRVPTAAAIRPLLHAGRRGRAGALRPRALRLRPGAPHPARRELRDPGRQDGGGGRAVGLRASPRWRGCCTASTTCSTGASPSTGRTCAQPSRRPAAPGHRHRAAGHGAVQRHGGLQHRLRPPRRHRAEVEEAARRPRTSTTSSPARPRATTPWWASAA
jgi:hypothetical protein